MDDPVDQHLVGDHDGGAVAGVDVGVGEGDVGDPPVDLLEDDPVADLDRLRDRELNPGDHVADRVLGGEADDRRQHRCRGEDPRRQPLQLGELAEGYGEEDEEDDQDDQAAEEAEPGLCGPRDL